MAKQDLLNKIVIGINAARYQNAVLRQGITPHNFMQQAIALKVW